MCVCGVWHITEDVCVSQNLRCVLHRDSQWFTFSVMLADEKNSLLVCVLVCKVHVRSDFENSE